MTKHEKAVCFTKGSDWLKCDRRFHKWAFKFTGTDVDLNNLFIKHTSGEFVDFTAEVALSTDEFLIVAAQTGSNAHHYYSYCFVGLGDDGEAVDIFARAAFGKLFRRLAKGGKLTTSQYTKAMASDTARMLAWAWCWAHDLSDFDENTAPAPAAESAPTMVIAETTAEYRTAA